MYIVSDSWMNVAEVIPIFVSHIINSHFIEHTLSHEGWLCHIKLGRLWALEGL